MSSDRLPRRFAGLHVPRQPGGFLGLAAALVALLALIPLGFVLWVSLATGWTSFAALVFRPRVGDLLINTLLLEVLTVPLAAGVAVALAWTTERAALPADRLWAWLAIAPLAVPAFVHSYAWISVSPGLSGLGAGVLISVLAYYPFLYLPVAAQLRRLDPGLEDQAAALGLKPWLVFLRVVLPQLRLALLGGSLLVGLHLLSEYGLYVMIRFDTFSTAIMDQFQSAYDSPAANMLGTVLVFCCLALLTLENGLTGRRRYARVGSGAARSITRTPLLGGLLPLALAGHLGLALLALGVPVYTLGRWLWAGGLPVWDAPALGPAMLQTLGLALAGGVLTTLAALPMAWIGVRRPGRWQRLLEACHYYVGALPGIVIALALVAVTIRAVPGLYQTAVTLLLAYGLMFLPRALVGLRGSIAQVPVELEQAAMVLGRTPRQALWAVTVRLAAPGAAAAMALVALAICNELTATLMLAPNGTATLATRFWALTSEIDYAGAAPYALLMVILSLPMTVILYNRSRQSAGR